MKLLLHACCGPCSLEPVRLLQAAGHDITIAYMNSNIAPADEYQHRLSTLLEWARSQGIPVIEGPYEPDRWQEAVRASWHPDPAKFPTRLAADSVGNASGGADATFDTGIDPEFDPARDPKFAHLYSDRDNRCRACYRLRLEELARYAHEHDFDAIGTTLSVSPYQYTSIIKEELERAAAHYDGLTALFEDFRPYYPNATKRSRDLGMYRQNYCGCAYSNKEAAAERAARKAARKKKKEEKRRRKKS